MERCELKIAAPAGYGVSLTVNSMNLKLRRSELDGAIDCHDYVQVGPPRAGRGDATGPHQTGGVLFVCDSSSSAV